VIGSAVEATPLRAPTPRAREPADRFGKHRIGRPEPLQPRLVQRRERDVRPFERARIDAGAGVGHQRGRAFEGRVAKQRRFS
jgi:hypothetical protein